LHTGTCHQAGAAQADGSWFLRIPTAYSAARSFQGGWGEVTYHLDGVPDFWIGEAAMRNDSRAFTGQPNGATPAQLTSAQFSGACMFEALIVPGHKSRTHVLWSGVVNLTNDIVDAQRPSWRQTVECGSGRPICTALSPITAGAACALPSPRSTRSSLWRW
jgi:hypothetical protein